ncbi:kinase-like domain-containing protein [Hypoxylon sp. FL1284]|nr:kinase-like domain-containing protein [Hypoxylon sp. FL1284]
METPMQPRFYLLPVSPQAKEIVNYALKDGRNKKLVTIWKGGITVLGIGHSAPKKSSPNVLAELGCGDSADIFLDGSSISKTQARFEINRESNLVMFVDCSPDQSSQVFSDTGGAYPFEYGRACRKVVVANGINTMIGMGGTKRNHITFRLIWDQGEQPWTEVVPRYAPTKTSLTSRMETRTHTALKKKIRYATGNVIGWGNLGKVMEAIDVDTVKLMAAKVVRRPGEDGRLRVETEIEVLNSLKHPNIVEFLGSDRDITIFTSLKQGSLHSLCDQPKTIKRKKFLDQLLHQMLMALDYLDSCGIIHRDVKPSNILFNKGSGSDYRFQLSDFSLCFRPDKPNAGGSTRIFKAPEIWYGHGALSSKTDIWSLYVTILYMVSTDIRLVLGDSENSDKGQFDRYAKVLEAGPMALRQFRAIREMARIRPDDRASAAQMLDKCYEGKGRATRSPLPALKKPRDDRGLLERLRDARIQSKHAEKRRIIDEYEMDTSDIQTSYSSETDDDSFVMDEDEEMGGTAVDETEYASTDETAMDVDERLEDPEWMDDTDDTDDTDTTETTIRQMTIALDEEMRQGAWFPYV